MLRRSIVWLAAALTSAVVIAFIVPLALLIQVFAEDRLAGTARDAALNLATVVSLSDLASLQDALDSAHAKAPTVHLSVTAPDGTVIGEQHTPGEAALIAQALHNGRAVTERTADGSDTLVPVALPTGIAVVHGSVRYDSARSGVYAAWGVLAVLGLALIAMSVTIAARAGQRIATPVTDLATVANRLRSGELDARAKTGGPVEIAELGAALNRLAERIGELLRLEREAAADLGHRLRTPVTALRLDVDSVDDPRLRARLVGRVEELQRAIDGVVADARRSTRDAMAGPSDLAAVVAARLAHWGPLAEDQGREVVAVLPREAGGGSATVVVQVGEQDLADLVDNLLDNVFAHTPEGAAFTVRLDVVGRLAALAVDDAGPGLAGREIERGVSGGGGTGLGLDIVRRIAQTAGGEVELATGRSGGLQVTVRLPVVG